MKVAIMGSGVMGRGWITQFAIGGHDVYCFDGNAETLAGTLPFCQKLAGSVAKKLSAARTSESNRQKIEDPEYAAKAVARIHLQKDKAAFIEAAKGCEIFFEVIFEDMQLKCSVLGEILPQLPQQVMFWSNTSSLDIDVMAQAGGRPERSIIAHGMNPVPLMAGVEVVPAKLTSAETVEKTRQVLLGLGKVPFLAPNIPGFWVNRLLIPQMLDAVRLLEAGKITVGDGDAGLNTCLGHPQGTFKLGDFVSTPTMLRVALEMYQATSDPRMYPPAMLVRMVKAGEFGSATGKGFYDWSDPRNPKPRDLSHYRAVSYEQMLDVVK